MKKFMLITLAALIQFQAVAGEKVNKTLEVSQQPYVKVEHVNGKADIKSWDQNQVKVVGSLGDRTDKFIFERDGNEVEIKVKIKKSMGFNWGSDDGDDLTIWVPAGSRINYNAVNADVKVAEVSGGAEIETVNGSIAVRQLAWRIRLDSVNGNIDAKDLAGDVKIETVNGNIDSQSQQGKTDHYGSVNGNIKVKSDSESLQVETVNGGVELTLAKVKRLNLETVNGDIEASMTLKNNGDVNASAVSGNIELRFQPEVSARFEIESHGGRIVNDLTADQVQKEKHGPNSWLEFSANGGDGNVEVSTVSGKIKLARH